MLPTIENVIDALRDRDVQDSLRATLAQQQVRQLRFAVMRLSDVHDTDAVEDLLDAIKDVADEEDRAVLEKALQRQVASATRGRPSSAASFRHRRIFRRERISWRRSFRRRTSSRM